MLSDDEINLLADEGLEHLERQESQREILEQLSNLRAELKSSALKVHRERRRNRRVLYFLIGVVAFVGVRCLFAGFDDPRDAANWAPHRQDDNNRYTGLPPRYFAGGAAGGNVIIGRGGIHGPSKHWIDRDPEHTVGWVGWIWSADPSPDDSRWLPANGKTG